MIFLSLLFQAFFFCQMSFLMSVLHISSNYLCNMLLQNERDNVKSWNKWDFRLIYASLPYKNVRFDEDGPGKAGVPKPGPAVDAGSGLLHASIHI